MIQNSGNNINKLAEARDKQTERIDELFKGLSEEYSDSVNHNPLYRRYNFFHLVLTLLMLTGIAYAFTRREMLEDKLKDLMMGASMNYNVIKEVLPHCVMLIWALLILIGVIKGSDLLRYFYSKSLERRSGKIASCRKAVLKRTGSKEMDEFKAMVLTAAEEGNREFSADHKNDLGNRISYLRDSITKSGRRARTLKGIVSPLFSAVYYLFGFVVIWLRKDTFTADDFLTYVWLSLFGAYTFFAIDVVLCSIGGYLGKLMRPFGCLLAAGYAGFLWYIIQGIDGSFFDKAALVNNAGTELFPAVKISHAVVALQFIAMIVGVIVGDYLGIREKWHSGRFDTAIYSSGSGYKTRFSVMFRMLWSVPWVIASWVAAKDIRNTAACILFMLVWWRAMPLLKPFGSVIYSFFGRGKCISIELMSFALLILNYYRINGVIDIKALIMFGIALVAYVIFGLIIIAINDGSEFFFFMHPFV